MRCLKRNKVDMKYANFLTKYYRYETDENWDLIIDYITDEGIPIYRTVDDDPMEYYTEPQDMKSSIAESGGEAEAMAFGLSVGDYEAVLLYKKGAYPLEEGSLVWIDSAVEYEYNGNEVEIELDDGEKTMVKTPDKTSADYFIKKIVRSLNFEKAILKAIVK